MRQAAEALGFAGECLHLKERAKRGAKKAPPAVAQPEPAPALAAAPSPTPDHKARRWVVERTHSWMNRFRRILVRRILVRSEKKAANYEALLHFACAHISPRRNLFG